MCSGPQIAAVAALIADQARASMLVALADSTPRSVAELAAVAGVTPQTASSHLAKLTAAGLLEVSKEGRSRFYSIADGRVSHTINCLCDLANIGERGEPDLTGDRKAIRLARICYGHIGGNLGVKFIERFLDRNYIKAVGLKNFEVTASGRKWFKALGIDVDALGEGHRGIARPCLDWSERQPHLGGPLADSFLEAAFKNGWFLKAAGTRALEITEKGYRVMQKEFGLSAQEISFSERH